MAKIINDGVIEIDGKPHVVEISEIGPSYFKVKSNEYVFIISVSGGKVFINGKPVDFDFQPALPRLERKQLSEGGKLNVNAPIPGSIVDVLVEPNMQVNEGDVLCVLEAMKMRNEIRAPASGVVMELHVKKNQRVKSNDLLVTMIKKSTGTNNS